MINFTLSNWVLLWSTLCTWPYPSLQLTYWVSYCFYVLMFQCKFICQVWYEKLKMTLSKFDYGRQGRTGHRGYLGKSLVGRRDLGRSNRHIYINLNSLKAEYVRGGRGVAAVSDSPWQYHSFKCYRQNMCAGGGGVAAVTNMKLHYTTAPGPLFFPSPPLIAVMYFYNEINTYTFLIHKMWKKVKSEYFLNAYDVLNIIKRVYNEMHQYDV